MVRANDNTVGSNTRRPTKGKHLKPTRFIARQLSRPTGLFGHFVGLLMNWHNARMNAFVVRQLDLCPSDRVLEIGFGGGVNLRSLIAGSAFMAGIDPSPDLIRRAKSTFADALSTNRAQFCEGSADRIPFEGSSFHKVCTVNTIYFWRSLELGFAEIHRVLSPGGQLFVGFLPEEHMKRMGMPLDIFKLRSPEEVDAALTSAGFKNIRIERPEPTTPWNVMVATK